MLMSDLYKGPTALENDPQVKVDFGFDNGKVQEMLFKKRIQGDSRKKKLMGLLGLILLLVLSGYGYYRWSGSNNNTDYTTMAIGKATISDAIEATATLSPVKQSAMGFKNDDTIIAINVQAGDEVKAGQILAQQDPTSLQAALQQAISTVDQDQISVQSALLSLENNRKILERQQKLFAAGALAQSDLDTAQNNFTKSEWEVATTKSKLTVDQTKVDQAQSDLSAAALTAPFDGIIGAVNGQVGQINGINSSSSTLLTIMSKDLQLSALVNEADIGRIKLGQEVEFTSSSYSDKKFKGKVLRITPQASTVSNVQYYPVLISCIDPDRLLLSGMSVTANIIVAQKSNVLTVPMMAVSFAQSYLQTNPATVSNQNTNAANNKSSTSQLTRQSGNKSAATGPSTLPTADKVKNQGAIPAITDSGKPAVVLVMKNQVPTAQRVLLGLSDGSNYEIVKGLSQGDKVVLGSTQVDSSSSSSSSGSSSSTNKSRTQQGPGGGMGGPPPGM